MNGVTHLARRTVLLAAVVLLAGCSAPRKASPNPIPAVPPPAKPTVVQCVVIAMPDVNPDKNGRASPIVVRLFELKSLAAFAGADFFSLYDRDRDTLGGEMVAREQLELSPGDERRFERQLHPETRHVGVIAAFRDLDHSKWRSSVSVIAKPIMPLQIRLDSRSVSINDK